jgi:WbqC-like protein family
VQSNYIPWKGYFDLINLVDEFILYDDRQYTKRDWRNRNLIKTARGIRWLTISVAVSGRFTQRIDEVVVSDSGWASRHWQTLVQSYSAAPCFKPQRGYFEHLYLDCASQQGHLADINRIFIDGICANLGIRTTISRSSDYEVPAETNATQRLVELCRAANACEYVSGPRARAYIDETQFEEAGIGLEYIDYDGYREYPQLHPPFDHQVSVLDLLFNVGPEAPNYMKSFR